MRLIQWLFSVFAYLFGGTKHTELFYCDLFYTGAKLDDKYKTVHPVERYKV